MNQQDKKIQQQVWKQLATVMDPELHVDIVSLGLIYSVDVEEIEQESDASSSQNGQFQVFIVMTLTTPGCPLAGVFDQMVKSSLHGIEGVNPDKNVNIELTFDPPWVPDMMSEEAKAELGFD